MKRLLISALAVGQVLGGAIPAAAQGLSPSREMEMGAFGGVSLRLPFGGNGRERATAGLSFAPTVRASYQDGRVRTRIGQGLELGFRQGRPLSFSINGRDLSGFRLNAAQGGEEGRRRGGISTGKAVLIVGGVLILAAGVGLLVLIDIANDASD